MQLQGLSPTIVSQREDLTVSFSLDRVKLEKMKSQLDEIFLALEALAGVDEQAIAIAASQLNMQEIALERMSLWQRHQPLTETETPEMEDSPKLNVEDLRSLVLIISHLAKQHQELIRRAVALLEQLTEEQREIHTASLLADYITTFTKLYSEGMKHEITLSPDALTQRALKKIMDLLFYSTSSGHQRLWFSLLEPTNQ
jgi:hypothetical protein